MIFSVTIVSTKFGYGRPETCTIASPDTNPTPITPSVDVAESPSANSMFFIVAPAKLVSKGFKSCTPYIERFQTVVSGSVSSIGIYDGKITVDIDVT